MDDRSVKKKKVLNWLAANVRLMRKVHGAHQGHTQVISRSDSSLRKQQQLQPQQPLSNGTNTKNMEKTDEIEKVDHVAWKKANDDLDAAIKTVRDMVSSLRLDVDAWRRQGFEIFSTIWHDLTAVEINLEESKAKITSDTDQAVNALNGRIDFTNKDLAATQESLHTTQNSLSDCFSEVAVVRSDLERNVADTEARLKNDIRQKQQDAVEKIGAVHKHSQLRHAEGLKLRDEMHGIMVSVAEEAACRQDDINRVYHDLEQQAELRSAEASRRLGGLERRMSGVQGSLSEHKRDSLKLRDKMHGIMVGMDKKKAETDACLAGLQDDMNRVYQVFKYHNMEVDDSKLQDPGGSGRRKRFR